MFVRIEARGELACHAAVGALVVAERAEEMHEHSRVGQRFAAEIAIAPIGQQDSVRIARDEEIRRDLLRP